MKPDIWFTMLKHWQKSDGLKNVIKLILLCYEIVVDMFKVMLESLKKNFLLQICKNNIYCLTCLQLTLLLNSFVIAVTITQVYMYHRRLHALNHCLLENIIFCSFKPISF